MVYAIARRTIVPILNLMINKVEGFENIPEKGPCIFVSRESSLLDTFLIINLILKKIDQKVHTFSTKRFWSIFGDKISRNWAGCIPVEKENKTRCLDDAAALLKKNALILIYPTGSPKIKEPKTGVSRLHLMTKVKLLPVKIKGTGKILPYGKWSVPKIWRRVSICIGKPFSYEEYFDKPVTKQILKKIAADVMDKIDGL